MSWKERGWTQDGTGCVSILGTFAAFTEYADVAMSTPFGQVMKGRLSDLVWSSCVRTAFFERFKHKK